MARVEEFHTHAKNAGPKLSLSKQPLLSIVPTRQGRALLANQPGASGLQQLFLYSYNAAFQLQFLIME